MEIQKVFEFLGIPKEKDERKIHEAYRSLLVNVNPEDDPEGFKRLREAYEEAIAYARTPDDEENMQDVDWLENESVGEFLRQVADVYETLPRRLDDAEWKALVDDPIFQSLDDGETAVWELFSYLADHFRLPCRIWRVLDGAFFIEENQREFREHLPEAFVEHIIYKLHDENGESEFPFERLKGPAQADYDEFISRIYQLNNEAGDDTEEGLQIMKERLEDLETFDIRHPWYDLERAKYLFKIGEREEAKRIASSLLQEHGDDGHVGLGSAVILQNYGHQNEAKQIFEGYLNREKQTSSGLYTTLYHLAEIEAEGDNWERARELALDAKDFQNTEEVHNLLEKINNSIITSYLEREESLTKEEIFLVGKCFYDSRRPEEGVAFMEAHPEVYEDTPKCHKLLSSLYWSARRAGKLLKETELWRQCLEHVSDTEPEQEEAFVFEEGLSWFFESGAYRGLSSLEREENGDETEAQRLMDKALEICERAIKLVPENTDFLMNKVSILKDMEAFEKVVDTCEEVLKINPQHFWACVNLQEAYEELRMAQEVIDTFYRAKNIYDGYPDIYLRTVSVFMAFNHFNDAMDILQQAEEAGIADNHELTVKKIGVYWRLDMDLDGWKNAVSFSEKAVKRLEQEKASKELLAEVYINLANLYEECPEEGEIFEEQLKKAEECALHSVELKDSPNARYFLGRIYLEYSKKDHQKAYEHLKICEQQGFEYAWMYHYIARCHEHFEEWDNAIVYYKKTMEADAEFKDALWRIGWLYRRKFERTEQEDYAKLALHYIDLQDEKFGESRCSHRWRARIYMRMRDYERALEEINREIEKENDSGAWFLKGNILRYLWRYDEAIKCYEQSIEAEDRYGEDDETCWKNIFSSFIREKRYDEGIQYFEKALERELSKKCREKCMDHLSNLEASAGRYDRAFHWIEQIYGEIEFDKRCYTWEFEKRCCKTWEKEADRIEDVMDIWQKFQNTPIEDLENLLQQAADLAELAYQDEAEPFEERALMCHNVGERFYFAGDCERAVHFLEMAYELASKAKEYDNLSGLLLYLIKNYYWLGNMEKAKEYGVKYRKNLEETYEECKDLELPMEELMTRPRFVGRNRLYRLGCWAYYTEQYDKAREYLKLMDCREMCYWCDEEDCTELWELKGMIAYLDGDKENALNYFEIAAKTCWLGGNTDAYFMVRKIADELQR